jgi:DNA mismatch endonuclease (patch repair protein)
MARQRTRDTAPEVAIRCELHRQGLRYRLHVRPEPAVRAVADLVFRGAQVAVFVDGCFWHGCPTHGSWPASNADWWRAKIERNVQRDGATTDALAARGWRVIRIWEHEPPSEAAARIAAIVLP